MRRNVFNILFFLSVALNLCFIGLALSHFSHQARKPLPPYIRLESQLRQLPQEQKKDVDAVLAKHHPEIVKNFRAAESAREELRREINSPSYSREKASKLFDTMQQSYAKMGEASQSMILDVNDALTPEQRAKFDPLPPMKK